jgi:hypothetical protein
MRHLSIPRALVATLLLTMALTGCGGDDAPSREEFAQNADKICSDVEDRVQQLDNADPDSPAELERTIDDIKSAIDAGIARLRGLERPDGEAGDTAEEFVTTLDREFEQQLVPALDQLADAARSRDEVAARAAVRKLDALQNSPSERIAERLGADECAEG